MHINKIHSIRTLPLVATELGEDEEWLSDLANEMDPEDGLIWVYGPNEDDAEMAFSPFGIENLCNLIAIHRERSE